jgi:hypothetical protein
MQTSSVLSHFNEQINNGQERPYCFTLFCRKVSQRVCEVVHIFAMGTSGILVVITMVPFHYSNRLKGKNVTCLILAQAEYSTDG